MQIVLEDLNFIWKDEDLDKLVELWKENKSLQDIAKSVNRNCEEVFLALMHLGRVRRIKKRKGFVWGS